MSNRDGKQKKKFRKGQLCPKCQKSKLEYCDCNNCRTQRNRRNVSCKTCGWSNF